MPTDELMTIGTVRDRHLSLMREWRESNDADRLERANDMRRMAVDAGRNIESAMERDEAQGIVDYWASAIAGLPGGTYPELLSISAYSGTQAADAGRSVRETYEELRPQEAQRIARSILEDLLVLGDHGVERDRPCSRQILLRNAGATDTEMFDRVIASLVGSGAIVYRASELRADDIFEAADGRIAESWPVLEQWLLAAKSYSVERARMMELAQRWHDAGRRPELLLLTSGDVEKALNFVGEDDLLDKYIESSRSARSKIRRVTQAILAAAVIVLLGALVFYIQLSGAAKEESLAAKAERDAAKHERDLAKQQLANATRIDREALATQREVAQLTYVFGARELQQYGPETASLANADAARPLESLPALSGTMWLGSGDVVQVSDLRGHIVRGFAGARSGTRYRARIPINLRTAMPTPGVDTLPPQKAVVPAGAQIVLIEPPRAVRRATTTQYWARVRVVPQVYIQYSNASRADVDRLRRRLADAGFEVPAGEVRPFSDRAEVRYFQDTDREIALLLQRRLNDDPQFRSRRDVHCLSFASSGYVAAHFRLELWYDQRRPPPDKAATACN